MESERWDEFVAWGRRMVAAGVDLEAEEHAYKRKVAQRLRELRGRYRTGDEGWLQQLPDAFAKKAYLLHHFTVMRLRRTIDASPTLVAAAVDTLWAPDEVGAANLVRFDEAIRKAWPEITPGNVVAIGSLLMMARDAEQFPPYRATVVKDWADLVGYPLDEGSPASRYTGLLELCDGLLAAEGASLVDTRLEAQGLAFVVLKWADKDLHLDPVELEELRVWRGGEAAAADDQDLRAWLIRPKPGGPELVSRWLAEGFVSLRAEHLGVVPGGAQKVAVATAVDANYQHLDYSQRASLTEEYHAFLTRMREGDILATVVDGALRVGSVTSAPGYVDDPTSRLRRETEWADITVAQDEVPAPLSAMLDHQGVVVDVTGATDVFDVLLQRPSTAPSPSAGELTEQVRDVIPDLPTVTEELARSLHSDRSALQEISDVLQMRQQIVLYGPPGTGKTYLALELAKHFIGDDGGRAQLVQFHPSYSYEDFFEGYRPDVKDGQATFVLKPGPLRLLAQEASRAENRGTPYLLIIDEMNRGNLAKVFGELYFLLEYRDRTVQLQYSPGEPFRLPKNLFIIGTMNTADRSIAMVDAAIRRRFAFVEMHPSEPPVSNVLERFVEANRIEDDRAELLKALNEAIGTEDRDLQIGPSYFMRKGLETEGALERVFTYDLMPLLEEHYYGRLGRSQIREKFGLEALRARLARVSEDAVGSEGG